MRAQDEILLEEIKALRDQFQITVNALEKVQRKARNHWDQGWAGGSKEAYEAILFALNGIIQRATADEKSNE